MMRTKGLWAFKTETIDLKTGQKNGSAKHYVWAEKVDGEIIVYVKKLMLSKIREGHKYKKVLNGIGLEIQLMAFRKDTLLAYAQVGQLAEIEFKKTVAGADEK